MNAGRRARIVRYLLFAAVVLALALTLLWPSPQLVDSASVDRGSVRESVDAEGRTRLRDRYVITAPVAAIARRLALEPGDAVKAGQVLVVLDAIAAPTLDARTRAEAQARIDAAEDRLSSAREAARSMDEEATQARAEAARMKALAVQRLVAADVAERAATNSARAQRDAASAHFLVSTAEHELQAAQAVLAYRKGTSVPGAELELTSPVTGVVLRTHFESARPVQSGEALLELGDPDGMEIEVDVLSSDAVRLRPGMTVDLLRWGETKPLSGTVSRIEPGGFTKVSALGVEEQRVWVIVELTSPRAEWERLGEAYRINARFVLNKVDGALRVPSSAVFRHGNGHAAFRMASGRARLTPIQPGIEGGGFTEVRGGLAQGDVVIIHPDRALEDGSRVRTR